MIKVRLSNLQVASKTQIIFKIKVTHNSINRLYLALTEIMPSHGYWCFNCINIILYTFFYRSYVLHPAVTHCMVEHGCCGNATFTFSGHKIMFCVNLALNMMFERDLNII